jgi:hypothetical protein
MRFFNRYAQLYALLVIVLTLAYYYSAIHFFVDSKGNGSIWWFALYLALIFSCALYLGVKDEGNGYMGFNYHFITYIIAMGLPLIIILSGNDANRKDNIQSILFTMLFWGIGLLFHFGMYLFMFRKKKIGSYEKDDVFK